MAKKTKPVPKPRRTRRTADQVIADLEARIAAVREREARKQARADPALRHAAAALRALEKALAATRDAVTQKALAEARASLGALLAGGDGAPAARPARARRGARGGGDLAESLLAYVQSHPGQRGEQIAAALRTDAATLRPAMKRLIAEGKVETEGQRRGMTYTAV